HLERLSLILESLADAMLHTRSQRSHWTSSNCVKSLPLANESSVLEGTSSAHFQANHVFQVPSTMRPDGLNLTYAGFQNLWWLMDKSHHFQFPALLNEQRIVQSFPKLSYVPIHDNPNLHV